jgi:hypothetical protein
VFTVDSARWFAVGSAAGTGQGSAAHAVDAALAGDDAKLVVVFCSQTGDLPEMLRTVRAHTGDVPLIGCTTAGEIAATGPSDAGIVVAAFGGDGFAAQAAAAANASHDLRAAGARAARCVPERPDLPHKVLLMLTDALAGDQQEIIRGAYGVLGAGVPLVGGCAGDGLRMSRTFQLHGDHLLTDSVVAAGIASAAPFGIGVRHGWCRAGEPMLVTASTGNRLYTLDDRPALEVYLDHLGADAPAEWDREGLARLALSHPLGIHGSNGEDRIRFIGGGDVTDGSLLCIAEVPQSSLVSIMEGDSGSVLDATDAACRDAFAGLAGRPPLGMIAFDCVARRDVLGQRGIRGEIERLAVGASGAPVAGFYTYGEIARTQGPLGFHNQTLVVLSVA